MTRRDLSAVIAIATLSLASSMLINAGMVCSNDGSQYALIRSLADGTAIIDEHFDYTHGVDYAQMGDHRYSDRPPGVAFLALPVYFVASGIGVDDLGSQMAVTGVAHVAGMLAAILLFMIARRLGATTIGATAAALALALCTPMRSYSATLFSHAIAAALVTGLLLIALPPEGVEPKRRRLLLLLGGVLGGYACGVDYTAGLPVMIVCLIGAWLEGERDWRRSARIAGLYLAGGVIGAAPALIYHTVVFGAPWSLPYFHDARFEYAHSVGGMYGGSFFEGFVGLLISPHAGLLLWSPILIAALAYTPMLRKKLEGRFWLVLVPWVALFLVTCRNLTWDAGATQDVRYLVSVMPMICLPLAWAFDRAFGADDGEPRPVWLTLLGFLFFASAIIQIVKHNALWARDGSAWIGRLASTLETDAGPTLLAFAEWAYPHPIAAVVVLVGGLAAAAGVGRWPRPERAARAETA